MNRSDSQMGGSQPQTETMGETSVAGERGTAVVNSIRSMQSRVSSFLAAGVMIALGLGALSWYYANALGRQKRLRQSAVAAAATNAQGEMSLPPLGAVEPRLGVLPQVNGMRYGTDSEGATSTRSQQGATGSRMASRVGPTPMASLTAAPAATGPELGALPLAPESPVDPSPYTGYVPPYTRVEPPGPPQKQSVSDRRLSGVAFARESAQPPLQPAYQAAGNIRSEESGAQGEEGLGKLLRPRVTTPARAQIVPTQQFLLPKGAFIDCTLETAIDSTLPGMTTCVTATDTFGIDGKVVLLERGSKLVGETRGEVQNGSARIFVFWTEARTPTGVVVPLESPGTDELGRSGLPGEVNRHFWDRFGAAMLISVIDGATQAAVQSSTHGGSAIIYNPATSQEALTDVLKGTINIAPTVSKHQGDRIQILVSRDLDFRTVYELRTSGF